MPYTPMATAADFNGGPFAILGRRITDMTPIMTRASRAVEARCRRRFVPFTVTENHQAEGIDPDDQLWDRGPLDLLGALGRSQAQSFGGLDLARHCWLREYPPLCTDLWTYSGVGVSIGRTIGPAQQLTAVSVMGPDVDTGHVAFRLGTYIPEGSTIAVTYSGGYTVNIPEDLVHATLLQAAKNLIVYAEPAARKGFDTDELDEELKLALEPYKRGA